MDIQQTITPIDNSVYIERDLAGGNTISSSINNAKAAQKHWRLTSLSHKKDIINKFIMLLEKNKKKLAEEITWQIGRPIKDSPNEINGAIYRTKVLLDLAEESLSDIIITNSKKNSDSNLHRKIKLNPLGIVFIIAPWNYPYLTTINTLIPALLAGNSVIIKHSSQTPLVSENIVKLLLESGLPENVCQFLHLSHTSTYKIISGNHVDYVAFTGSNLAGKEITQALANCLHSSSLELGGKDAAYVRQDTDLNYTVENLVDGVFYNAGQSCCGVERIYVDKIIFEDFVHKFVTLTKKYVLDNPSLENTTLGPLVRNKAAQHVRNQIDQAVKNGAQKLIDRKIFRKDTKDTAYLAPQVLINVDHQMDIMRQETFGPAIGIMPVKSDTEALQLINDSNYGLTCSLWTKDKEYAQKLFENIDVGTCLLNKCDYLDPSLAWSGVKDSGYGCSLSKLGFLNLVQPKSYYLLEKP